jgi:oligopeptide transport system substrate-binding protein
MHLAVCLILGVSVAVGACSQSGTPSPDLGSDVVLRRGIAGEPSSLDPAAAIDTFSTQVIQDLYEGLTTESSSGEVIPGVASSWTVDSSGTQYTFNLRSNARWSNGKPVRAQDFLTAWQRVLDPKQGSPVANDLRLIVGAAAVLSGRSPPSSLGVVAASDSVLVVNLEQAAPYFPELLSHSAAFPIFSESSARTHDPRKWISNGPYVLSGWQIGTRVELTRNMAYWDLPSVHIKRVQYQIAPDQNAQFAAYRAGQLDITDTVPPSAIPSLRKDHPNEIVTAPFLATAFYALNLSDKPFAGNLKLRKAVAMAIDRQRLVDALALGQVAAYGFVPPGTWNYDLQHWDWDKLSDSDRIAEAKRLYVEAGYSLDAPVHLRLLFNSNPAIKQTAIMIAAMWKDELGIETEFIGEEFRVFLQSRHDTKRWDVARLAWSADYNDASSFLDGFRENSPNNDSKYSNPSFDKLLDEAANTANPDARRGLLERAEQIVLADYTAIPLYFFVSKRLVKPYVVGVKPNPLDRVATKALSILTH